MTATAGVHGLSPLTWRVPVALEVEVEARHPARSRPLPRRAGPTAANAMPGADIQAFWEPVTTRSRPHSSIANGTAPSAEIASTRMSASGRDLTDRRRQRRDVAGDAGGRLVVGQEHRLEARDRGRRLAHRVRLAAPRPTRSRACVTAAP